MKEKYNLKSVPKTWQCLLLLVGNSPDLLTLLARLNKQVAFDFILITFNRKIRSVENNSSKFSKRNYHAGSNSYPHYLQMIRDDE